MSVVEIFFPTPFRVVVVWPNRYGVGNLQCLPEEVAPLPLEMRLAHLEGVPIRWRVGAREGLALWNRRGVFLIPRSTHVQVEQELLLPGELRIQEENNGLVLAGPGVPGERQEIPLRDLKRVVLALQADPPAVWAAGLYSSSSPRRIWVQVIQPEFPPELPPEFLLRLEVPDICPEPGLEIAPGFLAVRSGRELWAGRLAQNALPLVFQDEGFGLAAAGFSPRGRWLVGLRGQGERSTEVLRWRWARAAFRPVRVEEIPPTPDRGFPTRIAPGLNWAIRAGNRIWAIPLSIGEGKGEPQETLRRILPA